jgi:hypothetical protein
MGKTRLHHDRTLSGPEKDRKLPKSFWVVPGPRSREPMSTRGPRGNRLSAWTTPFGSLAIPGKRDPWLCVPPLRMVCLCRGTRKSGLSAIPDCQPTGFGFHRIGVERGGAAHGIHALFSQTSANLGRISRVVKRLAKKTLRAILNGRGATLFWSPSGSP